MKKYLPIIILILFGVFFVFPDEALADKGVVNLCGKTTGFSFYKNKYLSSGDACGIQTSFGGFKCWSDWNNSPTDPFAYGTCSVTLSYGLLLNTRVFYCDSDTGPTYECRDNEQTFFGTQQINTYPWHNRCKVQIDAYRISDPNRTPIDWVVYKNDANCAGGPPPPPPPPSQKTLTVTKTGTGAGGSTVVATGCSLNWSGNTGTCTVVNGTYVNLESFPQSGYTFRWTSGCPFDKGFCGSYMYNDLSVTADFYPGNPPVCEYATATISGNNVEIKSKATWDISHTPIKIENTKPVIYIYQGSNLITTIPHGLAYGGTTDSLELTKTWNFSGYSAGSYDAYFDFTNTDNITVRCTATFNTDTTLPNCTSPTVSPNPTNGNVGFSGYGSDNVGIARTGIYIYQGNTYIKTIRDNSTANNVSPLNASWDLTNSSGVAVTDGDYQVHYNWYDASNVNPTQCSANFKIDKTPPACVGWTYVPTATNSITVTANATDTGGSGLVAGNIQVEKTAGLGFGAGNYDFIVPAGTVPSGYSPYVLSGIWNTAGKGNGTYALRANWRDSAGNFQACNSIYALDKTAPTSSFTAPTSVCLGLSGSFSVTASDNSSLNSLTLKSSATTLESWTTRFTKTAISNPTNKLTDTAVTTVNFTTANGFAKGINYYFTSEASDVAGNKCSGNQFISSWPNNGTYDCGVNSRKTVSVVGSANAPTLNSASVGTLDKINLAWTDNSTDELGFKIYRKLTSASTWSASPITTVGANVTSYPDTTATCGVSYDYKVSADNGTTCTELFSVVKSGSCKTDNPTACGAWTFSPVSPSATNSLSVTARATDLDGLKFVNIRGYKGGGLYDNIYNQANTTGTAVGTWNTSTLATAIYQVDAIWTDNNNIPKTCTTTYGIDRTAPSQPGAITANATCAGVNAISWGASTDTGAVVSGLDHYVLSIDQDNNGTVDFTTNLNSTTTSYNLFNFLKGKTYKISVTAVDTLGNVSTPATKTLTILTDPAKPVVNPASVSTDRKITLTWPALGFIASDYNIVSSDTYGAISCTSSTCTAVSNIVSCGNHTYAVRVTNSCGYFATSDSATAVAGVFVTKPVVTTIKTATVNKDGTGASVVLTWPKDANATGYTVNKVTPPATYSGTISTPSCPTATTCSSTVTGLLCTNTYKYTVTATNTCGSDTSTEVSVKPNCAPVCSVDVSGGNKSPYAVGVNVNMTSTVTDEAGSTFSYLWSATGGSVTAPIDKATVVYKTSLATGASPEVRLNVTDNYGAVTACTPAIVSTAGANKGGHSLESGTIDRGTSITNSILLKYTVANYKNQDASGNSVNGTTTIDTSGSSMCNSIATCEWVDSAGASISANKSISIAQGSTTAYIKVTLKSPTNLRSGNYTFPVNFVSSVGNVPLVATVTVTNRVPTCTITGINSSPSYFYNRNQVIPVTLSTVDADNDTISSKVMSTSCGSLSALSNTNKADYTTPNINGVSCVINASVTDSQGGVGTCTATANVKPTDITVNLSAVSQVARNIAVGTTATISSTVTVTMENDQDGTVTIDNTSVNIAIPVVGSVVNLCKLTNVTCSLNSATVVNGVNTKNLTISIPQSVLKTLKPDGNGTNYAVKVNVSAPSSVRDPITGVVSTTTVNGTGGTQIKFGNVAPNCNGVSYTDTQVQPIYSTPTSNRFALGKDVSIRANPIDPDGDSIVSYTWTLPSGQTGSTNTRDTTYKTKQDFNIVETIKYTVTDTYGATCATWSGQIGTEASAQIKGRVFEVQTALTDDNEICRVNGANMTNAVSATLIDNAYPNYSSVNTSGGDFSGLKLKVISSAESTPGNATFCVTGLGPDYRVLDLTQPKCSALSSKLPPGGSIIKVSANCFTITKAVRNNIDPNIPDIKIPVKFSPNPYIVSQQGDVFSGALGVLSPLLKKPSLANTQKLISKDTALNESYGVLLSQADNHNEISWNAGNVDFTSQKGIFTNSNSITTNYNTVFSREENGVFAVLDTMESRGELNDQYIVYEKYSDSTSILKIDDSNYSSIYAGKILVVNGGNVEIDAESIALDKLQLFILSTGTITLKQFTNCTPIANCQKTIEITGALISGIDNTSSTGILDLLYGIQVNSSTEVAYKNASIKMIFDPSIYLNDNIRGVKVLNYSVQELSD